jgi:hypothetical protein
MTTPYRPSTKHWLSIVTPAWGHMRGEICLVHRLLHLHDHLVFTLLAPSVMREKGEAEMARFDTVLTEEQKSRLRVVWYEFTSAPPCHPYIADKDEQNFARWCEWAGGASLPCLEQIFQVRLGSFPS